MGCGRSGAAGSPEKVDDNFGKRSVVKKKSGNFYDSYVLDKLLGNGMNGF